jgi:hypothetical protein
VELPCDCHDLSAQGPDVTIGLDTLAVNHPAPHLHNLVLVAGHSVFVGLNFQQSENLSSWYLLDYQKVSALLAGFGMQQLTPPSFSIR